MEARVGPYYHSSVFTSNRMIFRLRTKLYSSESQQTNTVDTVDVVNIVLALWPCALSEVKCNRCFSKKMYSGAVIYKPTSH